MGVEINVVYQGQLRCEATHVPSRSTLLTDAPVDNHGKGETFSPTDLVATGLGACMLTIMGIVAQRHELDITGTTVKVIKEMTTQAPRRIAKLEVTITIPADKAATLAAEQRQRLETGALTCPVHHSLHPDIEKPVKFIYGE